VSFATTMESANDANATQWSGAGYSYDGASQLAGLSYSLGRRLWAI